MATAKVSLTLDEELIEEAREVAGSRGLSGYMNRALGKQLQHDRVRKLLAEMDEEFGPVDDEIMHDVRRAWPGPADAKS
jgi:hypothetical protein